MGGLLSLSLVLTEDCCFIKSSYSIWECAVITDAIGAIAAVTAGDAIVTKINQEQYEQPSSTSDSVHNTEEK